MGFKLDNEKSQNDGQLNFFDYKLPNADFVPSEKSKNLSESGNNAIDFNTWLMAHQEPEQNKSSRFMTISATFHAVAFLLIALISVPLVEQVKTETIEIEIEDVPQIRQARGAYVPPTQGGTPAKLETPVVEKLDDVGGPGDVVVAKAAANPAKSVKAKSAPAKATKTAAKAVAVTKAGGARSMAPKTNFKAVPMTIDDIDAPELDQAELANAKLESNLDEDLNPDFDHIDSSHRATVENERQSMAAMAAALEEDQEDTLGALDEENKAEANRLANLQNSVRQKNAKAIAAAEASDRANALAAQRAAALAAANRKAAAQRAGMGGQGEGYGTKAGSGAGNNGSTGSGTQVSGVPSGVRSLEQLRQMPGNPRPQYDTQERLRGDKGAVAFVAYINKEGYVSKFKMMKSTGFRNLDAKTLTALKKWRFYPGQEGWVELPFVWDLKGGAQEAGGLLRVSKN
ncbi:TonB family protein [Bdellovibrio reynosensis]|uniref:Energy transducer TonB n=1 Tax=Bdellovibrio reynosensis TaxID=2835041 RepID=A0ABY4C6I2_9BACT|nr:TonB family protein [Bdellovibrio reynosensis]UOF00530.1 energy transducer TonB [Bdellovibrio reynosensis]